MEALSALQEEGCEIVCVVRDEKWNLVIPAELSKRGFKLERASYIEQWTPSRWPFFLFRNPWAFIRGNLQFLDILKRVRPTHIHAFNSLFVLNFLPVLALKRLPMVYRAGDEPTLHNGFWRAVWCFVRQRTVRFVANSKYIARSLEASGVPTERIALIYNRPPGRPGAVNPEGFQPPARTSALTVAYIGQLIESKGPHLLIEAVRTLSAEGADVRLMMVGRISDWSGDGWARSLRDAALADPALAGKTNFTGYLSDITPILAACDVVATPSIAEEPLANVVMEAKRAGRPSVVFASGGLPEMVQDGVDGLICPEKSAAALADALRAYLKDTDLAARQGGRALQSLDRLGVHRFAQNWRSVYAYPTFMTSSGAK